jgi:transposase
MRCWRVLPMRPDRSIACVYLHRAPIDMRKQMNGLAALVEGVLKQNPFSGSLFVFINKRRDKLKMLVWDRSGFIVWYKRLEQEKFYWPVKSTDSVVTLSGEQLQWLLDGYDVWKMRAHKSLQYLNAA